MAVLIHRLTLRNYKSIAECDVDLAGLTFLVGPNGSGKSNFVDALRLVTDALRTSPDHALRDRGGIKEVRRRSGGHPTHFDIKLEFRVGEVIGHYGFRIGSRASCCCGMGATSRAFWSNYQFIRRTSSVA